MISTSKRYLAWVFSLWLVCNLWNTVRASFPMTEQMSHVEKLLSQLSHTTSFPEFNENLTNYHRSVMDELVFNKQLTWQDADRQAEVVIVAALEYYFQSHPAALEDPQYSQLYTARRHGAVLKKSLDAVDKLVNAFHGSISSRGNSKETPPKIIDPTEDFYDRDDDYHEESTYVEPKEIVDSATQESTPFQESTTFYTKGSDDIPITQTTLTSPESQGSFIDSITGTSTVKATSLMHVAPPPSEKIWSSFKNFWAVKSIKGNEMANAYMTAAMENPETTSAISTIVKGLVNYGMYSAEKIWVALKNAAVKIGAFVRSVVYGATTQMIGVLSQLMMLISIDAIRRGMRPVPKNLCPRLAEMIREKINARQLNDMVKQLVVTNRVSDAAIVIQSLQNILADDNFERTPANVRKQARTVDVQIISGSAGDTDLSRSHIESIIDRSKDQIQMDDPNGKDVLVTVDRDSGEIQQIQQFSSVDTEVLLNQQIESGDDATVTLKIHLDEEPPVKVLKVEPTIQIAEHLTSPATPWYQLRDFIRQAGRENDALLVQQVTQLAQRSPLEYQARLAFMWGEFLWSAPIWEMKPLPGEEVSSLFLQFYQALIHAYFPRDPSSRAAIDQEPLRQQATDRFVQYRSSLPSSMPPQPHIHLRLMEVYLEHGKCLLSSSGPQYATCKMAMEFFSELVATNPMDTLSPTPRIPFVNAVQPVRPNEVSTLLRTIETSDLALFAVAMRHLRSASMVLPRYSASNKAAQLLIAEYSKNAAGARYPTACLAAGSSGKIGVLEVLPELKEAYGPLENPTKEAFAKALLYIYFGLHPDDLVPITFHKMDLHDAMKKLLADHCKRHNGSMAQVPT